MTPQENITSFYQNLESAKSFRWQDNGYKSTEFYLKAVTSLLRFVDAGEKYDSDKAFFEVYSFVTRYHMHPEMFDRMVQSDGFLTRHNRDVITEARLISLAAHEIHKRSTYAQPHMITETFIRSFPKESGLADVTYTLTKEVVPPENPKYHHSRRWFLGYERELREELARVYSQMKEQLPDKNIPQLSSLTDISRTPEAHTPAGKLERMLAAA